MEHVVNPSAESVFRRRPYQVEGAKGMTKEMRIKVDISPCEMAEMFLRMDNDDKARFFNGFGFLLSMDVKDIYNLDLEKIAQSKEINRDGREALNLFRQQSGKKPINISKSDIENGGLYGE